MAGWPLKRPVNVVTCIRVTDDERLAAKAVQGTALTLQGVDDVHGGDGLALGVLCVRDGVTDNVLQEDLEDTARFFVDETADALHAATASQTTDGRLGDALDVITQNFAVPLGSALAESLASFAASSHVEVVRLRQNENFAVLTVVLNDP